MPADTDDKRVEGDDVNELDSEAADETVVMSEDSLDTSDISMEVNVEQLVKELDRSKVDDVAKKIEVRRKLEEIAEEQGFESTYAIEFDED